MSHVPTHANFEPHTLRAIALAHAACRAHYCRADALRSLFATARGRSSPCPGSACPLPSPRALPPSAGYLVRLMFEFHAGAPPSPACPALRSSPLPPVCLRCTPRALSLSSTPVPRSSVLASFHPCGNFCSFLKRQTVEPPPPSSLSSSTNQPHPHSSSSSSTNQPHSHSRDTQGAIWEPRC